MAIKIKIFMKTLFELSKAINIESDVEKKEELIRHREYLHSLISEDKADLIIGNIRGLK